MYRESITLTHNTEAAADEQLWQGNIDDAKRILDLTANMDRNTRHHHVIKEAALPLYDIYTNGVTNERIDKTVDVVLAVADLLTDELRYFNQLSLNDDDREPSRGRISELLLLGMQTLDIQQQEGPYLLLLPAPQSEDRGGHLGTDFYLTPTSEDGEYPMYPVQLKTKNTDDVRDAYLEPINVVGINELDEKYYGRPHHHDSLPKTFLRHVRGTAVEGDGERLDEAMIQFYQRIQYKSQDGLIEHPHKDDWYTPVAA